MTGGYPTSSGPGDVCHALSTGPFDVPAGDSVAVWFALLGGQDLTELQTSADQARQLWNSIVAVDHPPTNRPVGLRLGPARPNPSFGGTRLEMSVDRTRRIAASLYDPSGRRIRVLVDRDFPPGRTFLEWDGRDEQGRSARPGIYFLELDSRGERLIQKVVRLR